MPELDALIVPVSGCGMISGISIAAKGLKPDIAIIAAEPTGASPRHTDMDSDMTLLTEAAALPPLGLPSSPPDCRDGYQQPWRSDTTEPGALDLLMVYATHAGTNGAADVQMSKRAGELVRCERPKTLADGLRGRMGNLTWPIVRDFVDDVITVSEEQIIDAMQLCFERMKVCLYFCHHCWASSECFGSLHLTLGQSQRSQQMLQASTKRQRPGFQSL